MNNPTQNVSASVRKILLCFAMVMVLHLSYAQQRTFDTIVAKTEKQDYPSLTPKQYILLLGGDFKKQATAPFKMNGKQLIHLGGFAAVTAGLIAVDGNINTYAYNLRSNNSFVKKSSPVITQFGSYYGFYTVGAFELYGLISKDKRAQATGWLASQALITSGVWTRIGKLIAGRERPSAAYHTTSRKSGEWYGLFRNIDNYFDKRKLPQSDFDAFPSGHTSTAFSIATVFAKMYADKPAVPYIAYSAATLVAFSRLTEHTHWMSDIFVGAAIGYLCGDQVVKNYLNLFNLHSPVHKRRHKVLSL